MDVCRNLRYFASTLEGFMLQYLQYLPKVMVGLNIAGGAFLSGLPAGTQLPWWVVPVAAALNAIAHAIPEKKP